MPLESPTNEGLVMTLLRFTAMVCIAMAAFLTLERETVASSLLFKKIPESGIDSAQVEQARRIVNALYEKWHAGTFEQVSGAFTPEMQTALTPQLQEQAFQQTRNMFGDYQGLTFVEALTARFLLPRGIVYRFKGSYSRTPAQPEIRVVFDAAGKVSGLWLKPWKDETQ
jgi:hypothetical protein